MIVGSLSCGFALLGLKPCSSLPPSVYADGGVFFFFGGGERGGISGSVQDAEDFCFVGEALLDLLHCVDLHGFES